MHEALLQRRKSTERYVDKPTQALLGVARRRLELIPEMINTGGIYLPSDPVHARIMRYFADWHINGMQVTGEEYLREAVEISEYSGMLITSNHQTDLDHAARSKVVGGLGHSTFSDRFVFPSGLKMMERPYIRPLMGAENAVFIATPQDIEVVQKTLTRDKVENILTEDQKQSLKDYLATLKELNEKAGGKLEDLKKEGFIPFLYPEAGRTRHPKGRIQKPREETALYTYQREGSNGKPGELYIFPFSVDGLEKVLPPNKGWRFWRRTNVQVAFGQPYPASEIWDKQRVKSLREMGASKADYMMAKIYQTNRALADPADASFYEAVLTA